jgi:hypothetical protein
MPSSMRIVTGPEIFATIPDRIALLHLALDEAEIEIDALTALFPRLISGGLVVIDDYERPDREARQHAVRAFFKAQGLDVMEIATGQGLVMRR